MITKLALLTGLFAMSLTAVYEDTVIKQQQTLIHAMSSNKDCMADPRPAHIMPTPGGDPKPSPVKPMGRHDDNLTITPRTVWVT